MSRGNVLKAEQVSREGLAFEVLNFRDVQEEARRIVADARSQAEQLLEETQRRCREMNEKVGTESGEKGYQEGLERGLAEGREKGHTEALEKTLAEASADFKQRTDSLISSLQRTVEKLEQDRRDLFDTAREDVLRLAVAIASRVIKRTIEVDPSVVRDNVVEALELVAARTHVTVIVHPDDVETMQQFADSLHKRFSDSGDIAIVGDPDISRGGCEVRWGQGTLDGRLESQLRRITSLIVPVHDDVVVDGDPASDTHTTEDEQ